MEQRTPPSANEADADNRARVRRNTAGALLERHSELGALVEQSISTVFGRDTQIFGADRSICDAIDWALSKRSVRITDLVDEPPPVFNQALDALRHSQTRKELVFLLASSLERRRFHKVLPAHVEMIRQLTPDEFRLINALLNSARGTAIGAASAVQPNSPPLTIYRHVVSENLAAAVEFRENIPQYIDNLVRLGLLEIRHELAGPEAVYRAFTRFGFLLRLLEQTPHRTRLTITPASAHLTDLGRNLRDLCSD